MERNNQTRKYDKYDASHTEEEYILWLVETGQAEILGGKSNWKRNERELTPEECLELLRSDGEEYEFKVRLKGKIYSVDIGNSDYYNYASFGEISNFFYEHRKKLEQEGEYYLPGTKIRRYELPIDGTGIRQIDENQCIIADREKIYAQISGTPIFENSFILTDDKSIVDASREQKMFSDILYTKVKDSTFIETEAFIGYNDNQIMFIYDRGRGTERKLISSEAIQTFEREDIEHPVTMFSTGDTVGFIDGKKIRISDLKGEISTFELEGRYTKYRYSKWLCLNK